VTTRPTPRNDGDLLNLLGIRKDQADHGVARFVEGHFFAFLIVHAFAALGRSGDSAIDGFIDFRHANRVFVETNGKMAASFKMFSISAPEKPTVRFERAWKSTDGSIFLLRAWTLKMASRPAASGKLTVMMRSNRPGRKKGGIKDVVAVGRSDDQDAGVVFETIHLDEQLVQGLLAFIVAAAKASASLPTDGIDFINEDDAGCGLLGFPEEIPDTASADADEHFNEVRTGDAVERNARFACDRFR
jgi:hypothetical protein